MNNPALISVAAGVGVFVGTYFLSTADLTGAVVGSLVTAAACFALLTYLARRRS